VSSSVWGSDESWMIGNEVEGGLLVEDADDTEPRLDGVKT